MRIGILLGGRLGAGSGGGFTYEQEIMEGLNASQSHSGHEFILFGMPISSATCFPGWKGKYCSFAQYPEDPIDRSNPVRRVKSSIRYSLNRALELFGSRKSLRDYLAQQIRENGIDVVWSVAPGKMPQLLPDLQFLGVPYVATVWDLEHRRMPFLPEVSEGGEWERREVFNEKAFQRAAMIITGTSAGKAEIEKFYGIDSERIQTVPFPTPKFALEPTEGNASVVLQKFGLPEGFLFYPAQFWPHKNHVGLLHAIAHLRDEHGVVQPVVFVGSEKGNRKHIDRVIAELNLSSQVHVLGFVSREELAALYQKALALAFVTIFGPDNIPPLEAFGLGCPVIASRVAGAEEQLGEAALLFEPTDEAELALAILRIRNDERLRTELIKRGRLRAQQFVATDYIARMHQLFDELAKSRRCWPSGLNAG